MDPKLKVREVHTTCERCGIETCDARQASPLIIEEAAAALKVLKTLEKLDG